MNVRAWNLDDVRKKERKKDRKNKRPKKTIKSTVNVHDRTQIETVFDYYLRRAAKGAKRTSKNVLRYRVDAFLFYPRQFGIDPLSYPKDRFYSDVRPLLRLREPRLSYKQMLGEKSAHANKASKMRSPLQWLRGFVAALKEGRLLEPMPLAVGEVQIFACSFINTYLKSIDRQRKRLASLLRDPQSGSEIDLAIFLQQTTDLLSRTDAVIQGYREICADAWALPDGEGESLKQEMRLVDEYCYYRLRDGMAYLLRLVEGLFIPRVMKQELLLKVQAMLAAHDAHAASSGYLVLQPDSPMALKERFLHRRGELKRHIWAVLFLELRTEPIFAVQRHTGAMIAAGLAAVWAVIAQIIVVRKALQEEQFIDLWGASGLLFLSAAVFAYVVKDRIKEIGRSYFRSGLFRKIPDHSERIYYNPPDGKRQAIGHIYESVKYESLATLPADVKAVRQRIAQDPGLEEETVHGVLRYTKVIKLRRNFKILGRYPLRAVHDILRLNIDECLPRLGDPLRQLDVLDAKARLHTVAVPKIYYLDMALRYSRVDAGRQGFESNTEYFRLVVDKGGLSRVERLTALKSGSDG